MSLVQESSENSSSVAQVKLPKDTRSGEFQDNSRGWEGLPANVSMTKHTESTSPGLTGEMNISNSLSGDKVAHRQQGVHHLDDVQHFHSPSLQHHTHHHLHHHHHPMDQAPMHAIFTFYAVLVCMILAQTGLFWWKKNHKRSYELVTLLGLWLFPAITCVVLRFWRFLTVWCLFTAVTGHLLSLCLAKPMARSTPRKVYTWFLLLYKISVGIGSIGYVLLLVFYFLEIFGLHHLVHDVISKVLTPTSAILWIWYGLYFGILGRERRSVQTPCRSASARAGACPSPSTPAGYACKSCGTSRTSGRRRGRGMRRPYSSTASTSSTADVSEDGPSSGRRMSAPSAARRWSSAASTPTGRGKRGTCRGYKCSMRCGTWWCGTRSSSSACTAHLPSLA
uniref:RING finger protein 121 n=1 Tax=Tetraselmis sp. GSL018 TaxID=582737 RepID=A0A061R4V6_9CHLO